MDKESKAVLDWIKGKAPCPEEILTKSLNRVMKKIREGEALAKKEENKQGAPNG